MAYITEIIYAFSDQTKTEEEKEKEANAKIIEDIITAKEAYSKLCEVANSIKSVLGNLSLSFGIL